MADTVVTERGGRIKKGGVEYPPKCYFPIGYVYISVDSTNPSTYFGGTWQRLSKCFLYAADPNTDSSSTDPFRAGQKGGSRAKTIQQSNLPNVQLELTTENINASRSDMENYIDVAPAFYKSDATVSTGSTSQSRDEIISWKYKASPWSSKSWSAGQNVKYNNKYYTSLVNSNTSTPGTDSTKWQEVAEADLTWQGPFSADIMTESLNGGVTQTALDTTPEYLSVYMWKRTA